jgi:hypothetical protein
MIVPFRIVTFFAAVLLAVLPVVATAGEFIPRRVIALHHPLDEKLKLHDMHSKAEMPLNWLGYVVEYHDFREGLPEDAIDDPDVAAVLTWFDKGSMKDPDSYLDWALKMAEAGKKFIIFGDLGFLARNDGGAIADPAKARRFMAYLGIKLGGDWTDITFDTRIIHRDPEFYDYERRMGGHLPPYELMLPLDRKTRSMLTVRNSQSGDESSIYMISPNAAYVQTGWSYYKDPVYFRTQWFLNPFALFNRLLGGERQPVPDVTTLSGRRMYYSHIDGDGWRNVSLVKPYKKDQIYSARVVLEEAIRPYPDLPITVGPIAADLDPDWSGDEQAQLIAQELFVLPQVEMAHHTYSHPFEWAFFEDYTTEKEAPFVKLYNNASIDAWGVDVVKGQVKQTVSLKDAYDQPRGFGSFPFELEREFGAAADVVNQYAPPGKKVEMVLWSGDTSPTERMIRASREAGLLNLNGGDSRFDPEYPSVTYVPPVGFQFGKEQQIYASNSNENTYTDLWSGRYFGYRDLVHTLRNTESPRRLKPVNIYYHMYSGERVNALNGLLSNLDYSRGQKLAPVKASQYARIGEGFYTARLEATGSLSWNIHDRGALQTIRFDDAENLMPDMTKSAGVLGFNRHQGSLYVSLDPVVEVPKIVLIENGPSPRMPYLIEARWRLERLVRKDDGLQFDAQGFGDGEMVWGGMADGGWEAHVTGKDGGTLSQTVQASNGVVAFSLPADAIEGTSVTIQRVGG